MHAHTRAHSHTYSYTGLCPLFSSSEGDGHRLYKSVSHTQNTSYTVLCPLFSSSEGDGHRLYKPISRTQHHTQACVLCSPPWRGMGIGSLEKSARIPAAFSYLRKSSLLRRLNAVDFVFFVPRFVSGPISPWPHACAYTYTDKLTHNLSGHISPWPHACARIYTGKQACVLCSPLLRGMGIGFTNPSRTRDIIHRLVSFVLLF